MLYTIEGIDGVGKSTVVERLKVLFKNNPNVMFTKEPKFVTADEKQWLVKCCEPLQKLAFFFADHTKHMNTTIRPNVDDKVIICDRYIHSRIAYQAVDLHEHYVVDLHEAMDYIDNMHRFSVWPNKVFIIWSDKKMLKERLGKGHDGMDDKDIGRLLKIENEYINILMNMRVPYVGLDMADGSLNIAEEIFSNIMDNMNIEM